MALFCIGCGAIHDFDLALDDGTCIVCGDDLVEDENELPDPEVQMKEVLELASKLGELSIETKKGSN